MLISDFLLKVLWSGVEYAAMIVFSFALFRLPVKGQTVKIISMAFILSALVIYMRNIAMLTNYSVAALIISQLLLIMLLFRLPFFYALLLSNIGYLALSTIEVGVILAGMSLEITSIKQILSSHLHLSGVLLSTALILWLIALLMQKYKYGFVFSLNQFSVTETFKGYNLLISAAPILGIYILQTVVMSFQQLTLHFYAMVGMGVLLLIGLYISYIQNKNLINRKYERNV